jgi:hypothetical protein
MHQPLVSFVAGILVLGGLAGLPGQSAAVEDNGVVPSKGEYRDAEKAVSFDVTGNTSRKVKAPSIGDEPCPGVVLVVYSGKVKIKGKKAKFSYSGPATMYTPGALPFEYVQSPTTMTFTGKFTSKHKAKGSLEVPDCVTTRFTAKFYD